MVGLVAVEQVLSAKVEPRWAAVPIELTVSASLAWRRRFPVAVTAIASAGLALESIAGVPIQEPLIPLATIVIAVYSLVVHAEPRRVAAGLAIVGSGLAIAVTSQHKGLGNFAFGAVWVGIAVFIGRLVRAPADAARAHEERALQLDSEREDLARQAKADERQLIARELHDVIAHSVSVMVVQAGAAEEMLRTEPERALEPVHAIQITGREALGEMSRLLGVLRDDGGSTRFRPQPGLGELDVLVDETRAAGVPVELSIVGDRRALSPAIELSAYRIVQEALTNARRHAKRANATVTVRYESDVLELDIVDDGEQAEAGGGSGFGLVGMRERVSIFGGSLETGPRPGGGFGVYARLPLREAT